MQPESSCKSHVSRAVSHADANTILFADVSTAANIDKKHVKVTALRAGSVIVDMLIAKEAGDPHKIVQGLEEQLRWPDSLLRMGKLTRKTKGPGNRHDAEYCLDDGLQDPLTPAPRGVSQHNQLAAGVHTHCDSKREQERGGEKERARERARDRASERERESERASETQAQKH